MKRLAFIAALALLTAHCKPRQPQSAVRSGSDPAASAAVEPKIVPVTIQVDAELSAAFRPIVETEQRFIDSSAVAYANAAADSPKAEGLALDDAPLLTPEERLKALKKAKADAEIAINKLKESHPNGSFKSLRCDVAADVMKRTVEDRGDRRAYKITWSRSKGITLTAVVVYQSLPKESARRRCEHELLTNGKLYFAIDRYVDQKIEIPRFEPTFTEERVHGFSNLSAKDLDAIMNSEYGPNLVVNMFEINWTPLMVDGRWARYNHSDAETYCKKFRYWLPAVGDLKIIQQSIVDNAEGFKAPENFTFVIATDEPYVKLADGSWVYNHYNWKTNSKWRHTEEKALSVCIY